LTTDNLQKICDSWEFLNGIVIKDGPLIASFLAKEGSMGAKCIPVFGVALGLYFSYQYFKNGDTVQGILSLVSSIAGAIPGVAPLAVSIIIDIVNFCWDVVKHGME
jgi:hypothetical protein